MSTFDEDMREMRRETIAEVVFHINSSPKLYNQFKGKDHKAIKDKVYEIAGEHEDWFGTVFTPMLDGLLNKDWKQIAESI